MAACHALIMATMTLLVMITSGEVWKKDIKVRYYSTVTLYCQENQTALPAQQVFWITPDATLIQASTAPSDLPLHLHPTTDVSMLNITKVDDDLFGYYICVMIDNKGAVRLARWGLNVDGADFSQLEEQYRKNAVVGAIAAAVVLVLLGGACVIWHFRHSKRARRSALSKTEDDDRKSESPQQHDNQAFQGMEMAECADDKQNGHPAINTDDHEKVADHNM